MQLNSILELSPILLAGLGFTALLIVLGLLQLFTFRRKNPEFQAAHERFERADPSAKAPAAKPPAAKAPAAATGHKNMGLENTGLEKKPAAPPAKTPDVTPAPAAKIAPLQTPEVVPAPAPKLSPAPALAPASAAKLSPVAAAEKPPARATNHTSLHTQPKGETGGLSKTAKRTPKPAKTGGRRGRRVRHTVPAHRQNKNYMVKLMSVSDLASGKQSYADLSAKYPAIFAKYNPRFKSTPHLGKLNRTGGEAFDLYIGPIKHARAYQTCRAAKNAGLFDTQVRPATEIGLKQQP